MALGASCFEANSNRRAHHLSSVSTAVAVPTSASSKLLILRGRVVTPMLGRRTARASRLLVTLTIVRWMVIRCIWLLCIIRLVLRRMLVRVVLLRIVLWRVVLLWVVLLRVNLRSISGMVILGEDRGLR